jgi:ABC-type transport system involved in multi-copper enzyme maturation permease subunit
MRRTAGAIATLVGLVFIADVLVEALPSPWNTDIGKFLPGNAGLAVFSVRANADRLTPGSAFIVLLLWLVAALIVATIAITRRDA